MGFDNRFFDVNGKGKEMLLDAIKLAFKQETFPGEKIVAAYNITPENGFILYHLKEAYNIGFPCRMSAEEIAPMIWSWLQTEEAWKETKFERGRHELQHDGDTSKGWDVRMPQDLRSGWSSVLCCIRPCWLYYGK